MRLSRGLTAVVSANVIAKDFGYGLKHSRALAASVLADAGVHARAVAVGKLRYWVSRRFGRRPAGDVNIFLETLYPALYPLARRQLFIPNQEWFPERNLASLEQIDLVVCKTHHAEEIFLRLGVRTAFSSFTSRDRRRSATMRREFLCLGAHQTRAAARIALLWARHPEWPLLTLVTEEGLATVPASNIRHIRRRLPDADVMQLQNEHRFHVCVSRAEGFGHKLNEGMSCGAIVITTDGAPMNELIRPERGMLVKPSASAPMGVGTAYDFDENALAATIETCVRLSVPELEALGMRARRWFEDNDRFFRERFPAIVRAESTASA